MSIRFSAWSLKELTSGDLRILASVERGMINHEYVNIELIISISGYERGYVESILKKLNRLGLVQRHRGSFTGYILTSRGYDCLALNTLVKRGTLIAVSETPVGEGKESEVYLGKTPGERIVAVKVHRVGRTSFRSVKRVRRYVADKRHFSWLYLSRLAARNEYHALKILWRERVAVPEPIDWNRHIVVTEYVEGVELSEVPPLDDPRAILEKILSEVEKAYKAGVVHGDLNEFNVILTEEGGIRLLDWPQWVSSSHPNATSYLRRDVENIVNFFERKYRIAINKEQYLSELFERISSYPTSTLYADGPEEGG
ncbi:serine/threonine protein kinase [Infirmifilum lucidum]|uniref:non-specific serine/threonine protein kinase n=1 Tax=Infirmifilum lucidum TaxID=2776706 RepID=A0A7L9FL02_9CREN|nr:serine/threonine-protein kinase RIO2 [Infirmifilum lucidum]QOJ79703.1 serine/threonine protein kinase [Infirmifilum lucidum]